MKACTNVFVFQFFLHLHPLLCIPSPKSEIKTFSYKSQHFPMACLFPEVLHLLVGHILFLSPVPPSHSKWLVPRKLAEK